MFMDGFRFMMIKAIFSYISAILVEEARSIRLTIDLSQVTYKLYKIMLYQVHLTMNRVQTYVLSIYLSVDTIFQNLWFPVFRRIGKIVLSCFKLHVMLATTIST